MVKRSHTPILFTKSNNCVIGDGDTITIPGDTKMVWAEAELAVVIGRRASRVSYEEAREHILGYTIANDVNRLNIYNRSEDLAYGKCCDTFLPLKHEAHDVDPFDLKVTSHINGKRVQECSSKDLIFDPYKAVSYASRYLTLEPGDVVITGTDHKAKERPLRDGDHVIIEIEGLGRLSNDVQWEKNHWRDSRRLGA